MHLKTDDNEIGISKGKYISPEKRKKIIDELRLYNNLIMEYQKITNWLSLEQKYGLYQEECIIPIVILDLKLQC